jgi:protein TonB
MPQDFLRDVLRPGDAKGRRRRLSVLPVSIAIHAVVLAIFLVSPWIVEGEMPIVDSPIEPPYVATVPPPPPPAPPPPTGNAPKPALPPIAAPDKIADETPAPSADPVPGAINTPGVESGSSVLVGLSAPTAVAVPPPPPAPVPPKIVPVGGAIREPKKLVHVAPSYPEIARLSRLEGKVTMDAIIDATGRVQSVRVLSASPLFEDAAVRAVKQWRYSPTQLNGVPVPVLMTITVVFTLQR